ncbi:MAG: bifunctional hydroxymethylpyrimidine kinase/phosphomethylpyrimidine kinase [Thermoanaerobaculia bacterium]
MVETAPLRLLTIAGSDSGGGAGLQADLKTFAAHGAFGMSVVTAVTAQNTCGVRARLDLPPLLVTRQLEAVLEDLPPAAIKVGMLGSAGVVAAVAAGLRPLARTVPIVVDPVLVAGSGDPLLDADAVEVLRAELLPLATVITPNLLEAERLAGRAAAAEELALELAKTVPTLVKGGHGAGPELEDVLAVGSRSERFRHARLRPDSVHGTGCTLAAALAVELARGRELPGAVASAIAYVQRAIAGSRRLGRGQWVLLHPPETPGTP